MAGTEFQKVISLFFKADHSIRVMGYPLPMVFAEKIITAIARGIASTRWRDFADVILLSSSNQIAGEELKGALDEVARHRHVELQPLRQVLDGYPTNAQHRWDRWLQRQGLGDRIPSDFAEVLESVFEFADPALDDLVGDSIWIPNVRWTAG